jgi:hypothetical protein
LTLTQRDEESEEESDDYSPDTDESESDGAEYCDRRSVAAKTTAAPTPLAQAVARVKAARAARTEKGVKVQQVTLRRMVLSNAVAIGARLQYSFLHKGVEHSFEARLTIGVAARVVIAWSGQEFYSARKWTTTTKRTVKPGLSRSDVSPNLVVIPPDAAPGPAEASGGERCGTYWSDLVELCRKAIEKEREGKVLKTAANEAVDVAWAAAAAAAACTPRGQVCSVVSVDGAAAQDSLDRTSSAAASDAAPGSGAATTTATEVGTGAEKKTATLVVNKSVVDATTVNDELLLTFSREDGPAQGGGRNGGVVSPTWPSIRASALDVAPPLLAKLPADSVIETRIPSPSLTPSVRPTASASASASVEGGALSTISVVRSPLTDERAVLDALKRITTACEAQIDREVRENRLPFGALACACVLFVSFPYCWCACIVSHVCSSAHRATLAPPRSALLSTPPGPGLTDCRS